VTTVAPPDFEDEASLFSLSTEYLEAAAILEQTLVVKLNVSLVTYFLLGHSAELLLKSFLFKQGISIENLKNNYGHNLAKLTREARKLGLSNSISLEHVQTLSQHYVSKQTEYRQKRKASFPPKDLLIGELRHLANHVFGHIHEFRGDA
jgi:hypothetical protein